MDGPWVERDTNARGQRNGKWLREARFAAVYRKGPVGWQPDPEPLPMAGRGARKMGRGLRIVRATPPPTPLFWARRKGEPIKKNGEGRARKKNWEDESGER